MVNEELLGGDKAFDEIEGMLVFGRHNIGLRALAMRYQRLV